MNPTQRQAEIDRLTRELAKTDARRVELINELADLAAWRARISGQLGAQKIYRALEENE